MEDKQVKQEKKDFKEYVGALDYVDFCCCMEMSDDDFRAHIYFVRDFCKETGISYSKAACDPQVKANLASFLRK